MTRSWLRIIALICFAAASPCAADAPSTEPSPPPADSPDPALVTLHVKNASIDSVLTEISKQTGNQVVIRQNMGLPAQMLRINLDVDNQPFWTVLDQVCRQSGTAARVEDPGLALYPQNMYGGTSGIICDAGPIHLHLSQVNHNAFLTVPGAAGDYCAIQLDGMWEPRLNLLYYSSVGAPDAAVDENGLSLVPPPGTVLGDPRENVTPNDPDRYKQSPEWNNGNQGGFQFAIQLATPPSAGRRIAKISGTFKFWIAQKYDEVNIAATPPPQRNNLIYQTLDNGTNIAAWREGSNQIAVVTPHAANTPIDWQAQQRMSGAIRVTAQDGSGNTVHARFSGGGNWMDNLHMITFYYFDRPMTDPKVEYPDQIKEIDEPYSFTDLPLP